MRRDGEETEHSEVRRERRLTIASALIPSQLTTDVAYILGSPVPVSATFGAILNISMPDYNVYLQNKKRLVSQDDFFYPEGIWGMGPQAPFPLLAPILLPS